MHTSINALLVFLLLPSASAALFTWPDITGSNTGPYTVVSGITNINVLTPNGEEPLENDLFTHRYHHHTRISYHNNVTYLAFTSCGLNEGDDGMQTALCVSTNDGITWSSPIQVVPSQSTWSTNYGTPGARIAYVRNFTTYQGTNYLISAVDYYTDGSAHYAPLALIACAVNPDATIGPLFLISTNTYTATNGAATIDYDATLGPPLLADSIIYGMWGGGNDGTPMAWKGFLLGTNDGGSVLFTEPSTFSADGGTDNLYRLWRVFGGSSTSPASLYLVNQNYSTDGGATWNNPVPTEIPNSPSETTGLRLSDGRFAIFGNPKNLSTPDGRDPLFVALTAPNSTEITNVWAIRQGIGTVETYPGFSKYGGASYVSAVQVGSNLFVGYSIHKESIGFSRFPIPGWVNQSTFSVTTATIGTAHFGQP
jgi:hypothetical protein